MSSLDLLFWLLPANFVVHVLDETLMNGGFVAKVQQHWWPEYNSLMFSWFNTGAMAAFVADRPASRRRTRDLSPFASPDLKRPVTHTHARRATRGESG